MKGVLLQLQMCFYTADDDNSIKDDVDSPHHR